MIEALDLADNTVCYVDDISIPHTWRTIESYNNKFYIILRTTVVNSDTTATYNWLPYVLTIPEGNYDGYRLASGMQYLLNSIEINFTFEVNYNTATGTIKIEETTEGGSNTFEIPSDYGITDWFNNHSEYSWRNTDNDFIYPDNNNIQYINGVLKKYRNDSCSSFIHVRHI